jgi:hypothetical protein
MSQTTEVIEAGSAAVDALHLKTNAPVDIVLELLDRMEVIQQRAKQAKEVIEQAVVEWIEVNGEIEMGDIRWYVGEYKTTKCTNVAEFLAIIQTVLEDQPDDIAAIMTSQPFKHGATRSLLEKLNLSGVYDEHFVTESRPNLKTGKPRKGLHKVNEHFLPQQKGKKNAD